MIFICQAYNHSDTAQVAFSQPQRLWNWDLEGDTFKDGKPIRRKETFA
jgi:hypothetical protein